MTPRLSDADRECGYSSGCICAGYGCYERDVGCRRFSGGDCDRGNDAQADRTKAIGGTEVERWRRLVICFMRWAGY